MLKTALMMLNYSMGKVIYLKQPGKKKLSLLMVKTLKAAYEMQKHNRPIGQKELDGSFTTLVNRNLIAARTSLVDGEQVVTWYVTIAGVNELSSLKIKTQMHKY